MTQPLIRVLQIESDELNLRIHTVIQTEVVLDEISDVTAPTPVLGEALLWSGSPQAWRPGAVAGSGSGGSGIISTTPVVGDMVVYGEGNAGSPIGSPVTYRNVSTVQFLNDRFLVKGVTATNFGSPRFGGSPPVIVAGSPANKTALELRSSVPGLMFYDTDAPANEKAIRFVVDDGDFIGELRSDSGKTANRWLELIRSGTSVSNLYFYVGQQEKAIHAIAGAAVELYHNNINVAETATAASGGLRVNNLATGSGFERVLTTSDIHTGSPKVQVRPGTIEDQGLHWDVANNRWEPAPFFAPGDAGDPVVNIGTSGSKGLLQIVGSISTPSDIRAHYGFDTSSLELEIKNLTASSSITLKATNSSVAEVTFLNANPNSTTRLRAATDVFIEAGGGSDRFIGRSTGEAEILHDNIEIAHSTTAALGGFEVNNTLTGGGFERVLTISDLGSPTTINKFTSFAGDSGLVTADKPDNTLTLVGGTNITTVAVGSPGQTVTFNWAAALGDLSDVDTTGVLENQVLTYAGSPLGWIPQSVTQGKGSPAGHIENIVGGDGIDVTTGSPQVTVAVDSTVARLAGSPITTINSDSFAVDQSLRVYGSPVTQYTTFDMGTDLVTTSTGNLQFFAGGTAENNEILRLTASSNVAIRNGRELRINDIGDTDWIAISHDSTDINVVATNTTNFEFLSFAGDMYLRDGMGLVIFDSSDSNFVEFRHDGTDFNTTFTTTADWNITGLTGKLVYGGSPAIFQTDTAANGGLFVRNLSTGSGLERVLTTSDLSGSGSPNTNKFLVKAGSPITVINRDSLALDQTIRFYGSPATQYTDFAYTGGNPNSMTVNSVGSPARFKFQKDGATKAVFNYATDTFWLEAGMDFQIYGPTNAGDMLFSHDDTDFTATLSNVGNFDVSLNSGSFRILGGNNLVILDSTDSDGAVFNHDDTDFNTTFTNTTEWNVSDIDAIRLISGTAAVSDYQLVFEGEKAGYGAGMSFQAELSDTSTIVEMARITADGENSWTSTASTQDAGLRFFTTLDGVLDETMRLTSDGKLRIFGSPATSYGQLSHDGTDFNFEFANTTDLNISSANLNMVAPGIIFLDDGEAANPSLAFNTSTTTGFYEAGGSIGVANSGALTAQFSATYFRAYQEIWGSSGFSVQGNVSDHGQVGTFAFVDTSGSPVVARHGAYNWDTASWQPVELGGISATVSAIGDGSFTLPGNNSAEFVGLGDRLWLRDGMNLRVGNTDDTDWVEMDHDGTDFNIIGTNTADINITSGITRVNLPLVTASDITISNTSPQLFLQDTNATANEGNWIVRGDADAFRIQTAGDGSPLGGDANVLLVSRTGTAVQTTTLSGGVIQLNTAANNDILFLENSVERLLLDNTNGRLWLKDGYAFRISDSGDTDWAEFDHDGTTFNTTFANTTDWNIDIGSPIGDVRLQSGTGLVLLSGGAATAIRHDGTDVNWTNASTTDINVSGIAGFNVGNYNFDVDQTVGAGQDNYVLTYDNGDGQISLEASAAGGNVSNTGSPLPADNQVAIWASSTSLDGDIDFTYDGTLLTLGVAGGVQNELLLDANATDLRSFISTRTVAGTATKILTRGSTADNLNFGNTAFTLRLSSAAPVEVRSGAGLRILDSGNTDYADFTHNGTDLRTTFTNTTDWEIDGAIIRFLNTGGVRIQDGASLRIFDSTDTDYIDFAHDGTDCNTTFGSTTDWNISGITSIQAGTVDADFDVITGTTKSFLIDHPTKPGMKLRHGSLEGPEHAVYVRGRLTDDNVIKLPDYWTGLVDSNSITVNLTAMGSSQDLFVQSIENNKVTVGGGTRSIDCFYTVYAERVDVDKLIVEE